MISSPSAPPLIEVPGVFNFRDLGLVIAAATGAPTGAGRVFRADGLHRVDDEGRNRIVELGVRHVIDLRSSEEAESEGRFEHPDVEVEPVPIVERLGDLIGRAGPEPSDLMLEHYLVMTESSGPRFGLALTSMARAVEQGRPVVFHCTAGKDRTGVLAALVLSALGVGDDAIAADYGRSALAMTHLRDWYRATGRTTPAERMRQLGVAPGQMSQMMAAEPTTMLALLDSLRARHGSVSGYVHHIGAGEAVDALRRSLL